MSAPVAVIPKASTSGQVSAPQSALARPQTTGTPGASGSGGSTAASEADGRAGDDAARASSSTPTPSAPSVADRASDPGADDTDEVTTGGTRRSHAWDLVMERARRARHDEVVRTSGGTPVSGAESPRESEDAGPTAAVGSASEPVDDDDGRASVNPWDLVVQQARREARAEAERASERADERADERSSDAGSTTAKDIWSRSSRRAREERSPGGNPWARRELVSDETRALRLFDQGMDCMRSRDYEGARAAWREALEVDPNNRMIQGNLRTLEKLMSDGGNDD